MIKLNSSRTLIHISKDLQKEGIPGVSVTKLFKFLKQKGWVERSDTEGWIPLPEAEKWGCSLIDSGRANITKSIAWSSRAEIEIKRIYKLHFFNRSL